MIRPTVSYSGRDSSHPHSVAVGDFNEDGHMDIVVVNFGFDNVSIFLGYGNNTLESQNAHFTDIGSAPRMVAVGDFNNDHRSDIVIANSGSNSIRILFGNGKGDFNRQTIVDTTPSRPLFITVSDLDDDGCLDIVFTGYGADWIGVLLGCGNGTFMPRTIMSTGYDSHPYSVAIGDFNNDRQLDVAVANAGTDNVGILLGYGNGSFANQTTYQMSLSSRPCSIAVSDLNNDTYLDITVTNLKIGGFDVLLGYGNGSFIPSASYSLGTNAGSIFIGISDFNNDHILDITVANNGTDSVGLIFGNGNGSFAEPIMYPTGLQASPCFIGIADFNSDDQLDIAIVNKQNNNIKIFNSKNEDTFNRQNIFSISTCINPYSLGKDISSYSIAVGDFNKDDRLDVAVANDAKDSVSVVLGCGDGGFSSHMVYSLRRGSDPTKIIVDDFNNDNQLDIAVANFGSHDIAILFGYGNGQFSSPKYYSTGEDSNPHSLATADFNSDGQLDIAVTNYGANNVGILLGDGNGTFSSPVIYSMSNNAGPACIAVGDLNSDGHLDLAVTNHDASNIAILLGHGNGDFSFLVTFSTGTNSHPIGIVIADFNSDGHLDIAVAKLDSNGVSVLLGYGNGQFLNETFYSTGNGAQPRFLAVGDFNNDRRLDIVVVNIPHANVAVLFGNGDGTFPMQRVYTLGNDTSPVSVVAADFNNDNRLDIGVARLNQFSVVVLLNLGGGTFSDLIGTSKSIICPASIAIGDFDSDRQLDIVVANYHTFGLTFLRGYSNGSFEVQPFYSGGYNLNPTSIIAADFNKDGHVDIAVANFDSNCIGILLGYGNGHFANQTCYPTGVSSGPYALAIGDFNNDGEAGYYCCQLQHGQLWVFFLDMATGEFSAQRVFPTLEYDSYPISIGAGDFNQRWLF